MTRYADIPKPFGHRRFGFRRLRHQSGHERHRQTARVLGPGWGSESGFLGATGRIFTLDGTLSLHLFTDGEDDLKLRQTTGPDFATEHTVPTWESVYAPPTNETELRYWAGLVATTIRDAYNL